MNLKIEYFKDSVISIFILTSKVAIVFTCISEILSLSQLTRHEGKKLIVKKYKSEIDMIKGFIKWYDINKILFA